MSGNRQIHPLELNPRTGEPFLRLRNSENIVLTPPRESDVRLYPAIMNDPRIYEWLGSPPLPYTTEHAESWYAKVKGRSDSTLAQLEEAREQPNPILVEHCPVRAIREIRQNGEEVYIGDIGILRIQDGTLLAPEGEPVDEDTKAKYVEANSALVLGDPEIIWTIGYYIIPSYHGRGIMTDAVETLLWDWAVARMGVRHVIASAFEGNHGSLAVFRKNKFVSKGTTPKYLPAEERWRNLHIVEWRLNGNPHLSKKSVSLTAAEQVGVKGSVTPTPLTV